MVRCKFRCDSVTKRAAGKDEDGKDLFIYDVLLNPVMNGSEENKAFWKWTPAGQFQFSSINAGQFEPGKEYYIDMIPAN